MPAQHQNDMAARVARLLDQSRAAQAAGDTQALNRVRDEGARLLLELAPMMGERDFRTAEMLFEVAHLNLLYQLASRNWITASGASTLLSAAVASITHAIAQNEYPDSWARLRDLLLRMRNVGESAALAAHQSGHLMGAVMTLEVQTGIMFDILMTKTAGRAVQRRADAGLVDIERLAAQSETFIEPWLQEASLDPGTLEQWAESAAVASLSGPDYADHLERFYFTAHYAHTLLAARKTGRTILYVVPGFADNPGVAIRVNPDLATGSLAESMWLPGLQSQGLDAELDRIRNAFRTSNGSVRSLSDPVQRILDWTGSHVWDAIADRWPDLLSRPLAVVPVSRAALLPLYTATLRGEPACTVLDLTITPSARALHFAALTMTSPAQADVFVAADPWFGGNALTLAGREAAAIAGLYDVDPVVYQTTGPTPPGSNPDVARRLTTATVAHLACHGMINRDNLALLLGGVVSLDQVLSVDDSLLSGRPLVVLSACELGGFTGERISAEQYGFPAGLLAIGARAVVGALWPVPDSRALVKTMESLHRHLAEVPSSAALPEAIREARNSETPPAVWGSLTHFGV